MPALHNKTTLKESVNEQTTNGKIGAQFGLKLFCVADVVLMLKQPFTQNRHKLKPQWGNLNKKSVKICFDKSQSPEQKLNNSEKESTESLCAMRACEPFSISSKSMRRMASNKIFVFLFQSELWKVFFHVAQFILCVSTFTVFVLHNDRAFSLEIFNETATYKNFWGWNFSN